MTGSRPLLVATDIDGTLVDRNDRIPAANRAVIAELVADGATFVLATGRPPRWLSQVVDQLPVAPLAVCANGAVVMDTASGEFLSTRLLEAEALAAIDEVLRDRLPGSGIAAERLGVDAADREFVASPDYEHAWIQPEHLEVGHSEVLARPVLKLLARVPGMPSADMVEALRGEVHHLADVTYSTTDGLIEFAARGVTKASGLAELAAGLGRQSRARPGAGESGTARETLASSTALGTLAPGAVPVTVAFGDMPNDLEMLRWADHGVAMGNAIPVVHAAADEITLTNDEAGLAHVLRRWWN
ncbi:MAG: HAD family hydrolase [Dietzia psychralcaliphila]